jgi:hypothetical protein
MLDLGSDANDSSLLSNSKRIIEQQALLPSTVAT